MEKRRVTIAIGGQLCGLSSDDTDEYLSALEQRANDVMRRTARFAGSSSYANALLSVLSLTDELLRAEEKIQEMTEEQKPGEARSGKKNAKAQETDPGQVSVWDILNGGKRQ